jgi:CLIP-associating protein 1/2
MHWVVRMNRDEALPFKSFVPSMVANLEDHDGAVRDSAKSALVDLFRYVASGSQHARFTDTRSVEMRQTVQRPISRNN